MPKNMANEKKNTKTIYWLVFFFFCSKNTHHSNVRTFFRRQSFQKQSQIKLYSCMNDIWNVCMHDGKHALNSMLDLTHTKAALNLTAHFWQSDWVYAERLILSQNWHWSKKVVVSKIKLIRNILSVSLIKCTIFQYLPGQFVKNLTEIWKMRGKIR